MRLALATHAGLTELYADEPPFVAALAARGHEARAAVWSDPTVDWQAFDAVLLRSCWDYHLALPAFRAWLADLDALDVAVWNPTALVRWNLDKRYLLELEERGVAIVPTGRLEPDEPGTLRAVMDARGWDEAVVKPAVSMSAYETWRAPSASARELEPRFAALRARGPVLVQPFVPEVATKGESSLVFFDGAFSHAVLKRAAPGDFRVQREFGGEHEVYEPSPAHVRVVERALAALPCAPLYARFDGVEVDGRVLLIELELIDPELCFRLVPEAAPRLVEVLERVARTG